MLRSPRHRMPRTLVIAAITLALAWPSAGPVQAQEDTGQASHALLAPVYAYANGGASLFLANTGGATARALVAIRDADGALVGCGSGLLASGESDFLYLRPHPTPDTVLTLKVYGFAPDRPLDGKNPREQTGLVGNVTLLDGASGESNGVIELLEVPTTAKARSADVADCLRVGSSATLGSGGGGQANKVLSSTPPARWGDPDPAPKPAAKDQGLTLVKASSTSSDKGKDNSAEDKKNDDKKDTKDTKKDKKDKKD